MNPREQIQKQAEIIHDANVSVGFNQFDPPSAPLVMPSPVDRTTPWHKVSLVPNPASSDISLGFISDDNAAYSLDVRDVKGEMVYNEIINAVKGENNFSIHINTWSPGVYYLEIRIQDKLSTFKFVKQ